MMKKSMLVITLLLLLIGCNNSSSVISELNMKDLNKDVATFLGETKETNGIYLFSRVNEKQYLILNNMHINQNENATYIKSIEPEIQGRTLVLKIVELSTENLNDERVGKLKVYKLNREIEYDTIRIFKNEKETKIDLVGG